MLCQTKILQIKLIITSLNKSKSKLKQLKIKLILEFIFGNIKYLLLTNFGANSSEIPHLWRINIAEFFAWF